MPSDVLAERDSRLESLKAVAGHLAHDFNNFLVPFLGYISLIEEEAGKEFGGIEYLRKMESSARRVESTLNSMLLATRPRRRFAPRTTDFAALVQNVVEQWTSALPSSSGLNVTMDLAPCTRVVDESHWRGAIEQLLANAQFASPGGGEITVLLASEMLDPEEMGRLGLSQAEVAKLVVRDSGVGMPESVASRAFEPFFTTRKKGQALGLGLTIVHSVARLHHGQVTLESVEDEGTTVAIWLPPAEAESLLAPSISASRAAQRGAKVLLASCDPAAAQGIELYLRNMSFEIVTAATPEQALAMYSRAGELPRVVVADSTTPNPSGFEFAEELRRKHPSTSVIMIVTESVARAASAGVAMDRIILLRRPFSLKALHAAICSCL